MPSIARLEADLTAQLGPEFEVVRALGGGPLSTVYLAREPALQRLVAIKVLHPAAARHPKRLARFRREARALARVSHPSVVSIFRVGDLSADTPYLIMQYVRGTDLAQVLAEHGPLEPAAACRLLASVARALQAVHAHDMAHRDVRPESVLCEHGSDRVLLADFGLAAFLGREGEEGEEGGDGRLTTAGHLVTDLRFTSPEALSGTDPTSASDVYSLGILAYHVLAGSGPYRAGSAATHARAHLEQSPLPLSALGVEVPASLQALLHDCLAKQPGERPAASDVARVLADLSAAGVASQVEPPVVVARTPAPARPAGDASPTYSIRMLGSLDLRSAKGALSTVLRQPKRVALLAFLAAGPLTDYRRRETLIGMFWPDSGPDSGRHSLRQALYVLRRELGPDVIVTRGDEDVGLNADRIHSDVARFDELADAGRPAEALELYHGDLLPGFFLDDTPAFERWLDVERVRLRRKASAQAWKVSEQARATGQKAQAGEWARVAVDLDPFDEVALYRLIELLDTLGDRAGAVAAYDHFEARLSEEYAAEPSPETRQLLERVRGRR